MQENNEKTKQMDSSSKKSKNNIKKQGFFEQCKNEFKKITWPTRPVLIKQTITVIIISLAVGVIIFGYDLGIGFIFDSLTKLIA